MRQSCFSCEADASEEHECEHCHAYVCGACNTLKKQARLLYDHGATPVSVHCSGNPENHLENADWISFLIRWRRTYED
jgi:hypothetical protein